MISNKTVNLKFDDMSKTPILCTNERYIFNLNLQQNSICHGIKFNEVNLKILFPDYWKEFFDAYPEMFGEVDKKFIFGNNYSIIEDLSYINEKQNLIFKLIGKVPILEIINVDE